MTHAEPLIVHCPHGDEKLSQTQLGSGNTFGARYWTDGKRDAPMLPHIPDLVRCPHCNELLLVSEAREEAEESESRRFGHRQSRHPRGVEPELADWLEAIEKRLWKDDEGEQYLRFFAWIAANDAWRPSGNSDGESDTNGDTNADSVTQTTATANFTAADVSNLQGLMALLEKSDEPDALITRAEILRELGDFQGSIQLLDTLTDEQYAFACNLIRGLAEKGVREVQEMKFE